MQDSDPTTWVDPQFHPDFGIDSNRDVSMLRDAAIACGALPSVTVQVRLVVDRDEGLLYCELTSNGEAIGDLFCHEPLRSERTGFVLVSEPAGSPREYEFYAKNVADVARLVDTLLGGDDIEKLQDTHREF